MELAPSDTNLTFEVTFDAADLNVAMSVYDTSGSSPVLVQGPSAMTVVVGNTYIGKFVPIDGHAYLIFKAVYTTSGFSTLDTDYAQGTESIIAENVGGGGSGSPSGSTVIGIVIPDVTVIGIVEC